MINTNKRKHMDDISKIIEFLLKLNFKCDSFPSSQRQIYSKNKDIIIIKNNKK